MTDYDYIKNLSEKVLIPYAYYQIFRNDIPWDAKMQHAEELAMDAWKTLLSLVDKEPQKYAHLWNTKQQKASQQQIIYLLKRMIKWNITDFLASKKDFLKYQPETDSRVKLMHCQETTEPLEDDYLLKQLEDYLLNKGLKPAALRFIMCHLQGTFQGYTKEELLDQWNATLNQPIGQEAYDKKLQRIRKQIAVQGGNRRDLFFIFIAPTPITPSGTQKLCDLLDSYALVSKMSITSPHLSQRATSLLYGSIACLAIFCGLMLLTTDAYHHPKKTESLDKKAAEQEEQQVQKDTLIPVSKTTTKQATPGKPISIPQTSFGQRKTPALIATQAIFPKQKETLPRVLPANELLSPVFTQKENKASLRTIAADLPSSLSQVFQQLKVGWPAKLATIAPLKKSYTKAKRRYQKIAQKLIEYTRYLKNKRQTTKSYNYKKHKRKGIGVRANRFRPNKRQKAKMRKIAQRKRKLAKKQGRKKVRWRTQMNALKREMRDLQKQALKQTFILLAVKQSESEPPLLLRPKNAFTLTQLKGLMLGFALPEQIQEPLQLKLYTLDKTAAQPKQLLLRATLKANHQGIVQQYITFKKYRLSAKSNYLIIEIVKKRKKYRDEQLTSHRFQVGQ